MPGQRLWAAFAALALAARFIAAADDMVTLEGECP